MAIKTITIDELDGFSVDAQTNELYWHGKKIRTELTLPRWFQPSAFVVTASTLIQAIDVIVKWFRRSRWISHC